MDNLQTLLPYQSLFRAGCCCCSVQQDTVVLVGCYTLVWTSTIAAAMSAHGPMWVQWRLEHTV